MADRTVSDCGGKVSDLPAIIVSVEHDVEVAEEEGDIYGARCDFGDYPHEAEDWIYRFINQHESVTRLRERTREAGGTDQEGV